MSKRLNKEAVEQITEWVRRLWPDADMWWGLAVAELLEQVFCEYTSRSGYVEQVSAAVPEMAGRLQELRQIYDEDRFCSVFVAEWQLSDEWVGREMLVYHEADNTVAWYAADTGDGIPVSYHETLPPGKHYDVRQIVAAWLAASAEGWSCCIE